MSEEGTSTLEETTTEEAPAEEAPAEVVPEPVVETAPEPSTADDDKSSEISGSIGTGKKVFSGMCKLCGARIASGPVNTEGKVHCLTCKGDF